jgi:hypothetical protein
MNYSLDPSGELLELAQEELKRIMETQADHKSPVCVLAKDLQKTLERWSDARPEEVPRY